MIYRTKTKYYPHSYLGCRPDIFAVDSEVIHGLVFAVQDDHFYVLKGKEAMVCPMNEVNDLIAICTNESLQAEIKEIADDIIQYDRGHRLYAKFSNRKGVN